MQAPMTRNFAPRNDSLDNVRTLLVLAILLLHAACAYAFGIPWWHAQDHKHLLFDLLIVSVDNFALPALYFVAGTFALPSLDRHGDARFLVRKLKRLGLPVVVLSTFYLPAMVYMGYLRRAENPTPFLDYWLQWLVTLTDWNFVIITSMETGAPYIDALSPHHLWFMSLLLVFFAGYALCRKITPPRREKRRLSWLGVLAWGAVMALGYATVNALVQDWTWARLGPFLLFQPSRLPVYAAAFVFGVRSRSRLASGDPMPGPVWAWLAVFLVSQAAMIACVNIFIAAPGPATLPTALAHGALRAVLTVSAICLLVNASRRFLAGPSTWRQSLAASSYDIYMLHMPLTILAQTAFVALPLPLFVKMSLAFTTTLLLCWGLSRTMAPRGPWLPATLLAGWFALFCLVW